MKYTLLILSIATLWACNNKSSSNENTTITTADTARLIGGDKDEHGCKGSAGQTWSALRAECIQVFNTGIRLNPVETKADEAIISAFAVYNTDSTKVEIFLPQQEHTTILDQSSKGVFNNATLAFDSQKGTLSIEGRVMYKTTVE
jgi:hypothetical protein